MQGSPTNGGAPYGARAVGARVVRLADARDAHGRFLFARGAIPRRNLMGGARPTEPVPSGVFGDNHPHERLPPHEIYGGWWPWRREGVNWGHLEELQDGARADVARVIEHGVGSSRSAMVGHVTFGLQIPPVIRVDRTVCHTEMDALLITVIDGYVNRMFGTGVSAAVQQLVVGTSLSRAFMYKEERDVGVKFVAPLAGMRAPEKGARLRHRMEWLCLRRGKVVTWVEWVVLSIERGWEALAHQGTATKLLASGIRGSPKAFPSVPSRFRELMPPEGMSLPPLVSWQYFGEAIAETDARVAWRNGNGAGARGRR